MSAFRDLMSDPEGRTSDPEGRTSDPEGRTRDCSRFRVVPDMARLATVLNGFTTVGTLQDPWFTAGSWSSYKSFIPHVCDALKPNAGIGRMVTGDEVASTVVCYH